MNEPKTPNLGLNKIDRSSPSTTYFDLDKYLDQNWEKVDEGVGQVEEKAEETAAQVSSIQERLDTEKRRSVTLEPGLQIINAERASAFKLEGLKGRTLVNLLGRDGGFEGYSSWAIGATSAILDTSTYAQGSLSSLKVTLASSNSNISKAVSTTIGKTYLLLADVKNVSTTEVFVSISTIVNGSKVTGSQFTTSFAKFTATATTHAIAVVGSGSAGQVFNVDNVRLYEISASDDAVLDNITQKQIAVKYPYVDSVQPVKNPYLIRYGENLLPPFYEWSIQGIPHSITSPYEIVRSATDELYNGASLTVKVPVVPGNMYTLNYEIIGDVTKAYINWSWNDKDDNRISWTDGNKDTVTAVAPNDAVTADVRVTGTAPGTFTFKNPMLTLGTTVKPFKPRKDDILALQTQLYADPLTGTNADEVFEKDGQHFKLSKWKKITLNSNYSYTFFNSYTGGKCVRLTYDIADRNKNVLPTVTKFNGSYLSAGSPSLYVDQYSRGDWDTGAGGAFLGIGVSTADSGWGDSYTPTGDEIKAYFMGWKMFLNNQPDVSKPYNGEAAGKAWCPLDSIYMSGGAASFYTNTLPLSPITVATYTRHMQWTPYQLVYQLATPTVEPITSEGQLTLIEGNNQVEVGTGVVLREIVKPVLANSYYRFNDTTLAGTILKNKLAKPLVIYRNGQRDNGWEFISDQYAYGVYKARKVPEQYDPTAMYTVTYIIQDTSPAAPFVGSVAENEKALLTDMNDVVRQNAASVSVVETAVNEAVRTLLQQQNKRNVWGPIE
ncbi:hypothetical protein QP794_15815 [Paenibacillus sp. UMB7766-LJ446]|uniref:hypothetical protein n=1 Tax=Paenibacillus sp. UMB7766-LJ446 TaxID=3046313 RepID=UPI0025503F8B|nr:hypothetical protein [Paenibacillus sp. UMB7766-LJ446]MDK8191554.1 hypothetical protein [Paenibacillus sp. UMB7766-LJ446]